MGSRDGEAAAAASPGCLRLRRGQPWPLARRPPCPLCIRKEMTAAGCQSYSPIPDARKAKQMTRTSDPVLRVEDVILSSGSPKDTVLRLVEDRLPAAGGLPRKRLLKERIVLQAHCSTGRRGNGGADPVGIRRERKESAVPDLRDKGLAFPRPAGER